LGFNSSTACFIGPCERLSARRVRQHRGALKQKNERPRACTESTQAPTHLVFSFFFPTCFLFHFQAFLSKWRSKPPNIFEVFYFEFKIVLFFITVLNVFLHGDLKTQKNTCQKDHQNSRKKLTRLRGIFPSFSASWKT
jgi:hypothetical protein